MTTAVAIPTTSSGRMTIHASYAALVVACIGFALTGLGNILAAPTVTTYPSRLSWILQFIGPMLLALAVTLHIDHLSPRIGRSAVVLIIVGAFLTAVSSAPFMFRPTFYTEEAWFNLNFVLWGVGYIAMGLGLASVAMHKEKQLERALGQPAASSTDDEDYDLTVHASFLSLITASVGLILYAIGYLQLVGHPLGTRSAWSLQTIGGMLIALGIVTHITHLRRRIGTPAVVFGLLGAACMAFSCLPYAVNPSNILSPSWGQCWWSVWGAGAVFGAVGIGLVILRKRSIEAEAAS